MEFKAFSEIKALGKMQMSITQKIHGTNAHIMITPDETTGEVKLQAASRTKFIFPGKNTDNYGFAQWCEDNKEELIRLLGIGRHDGEWAGPGINSGEGLTQKMFVLFDHWKWPAERQLPVQCAVVPVLYHGPIDLTEVQKAMDSLQREGSRLVPGFMRPEGCVVQFAGVRYKQVFDKETTKWNEGADGPKEPKTPGKDYSHLLQPIRLEKLMSRDEANYKGYPANLKALVHLYFQDLIKEGEIGGSEEAVAALKKDAAGQVFAFIKAVGGPLVQQYLEHNPS